jgi:hypothetical protein
MVFFPMGYINLIFYQDFLVNAFLWMFIGILFRLPQVALSAQFATDEESVTRRGVSGQATEPSPQPAT